MKRIRTALGSEAVHCQWYLIGVVGPLGVFTVGKDNFWFEYEQNNVANIIIHKYWYQDNHNNMLKFII